MSQFVLKTLEANRCSTILSYFQSISGKTSFKPILALRHLICNSILALRHLICNSILFLRHLICNSILALRHVICNSILSLRYLICNSILSLRHLICNSILAPNPQFIKLLIFFKICQWWVAWTVRNKYKILYTGFKNVYLLNYYKNE